MEQLEAKETPSVTRGQNALYVMPHDWASIAYFLGPMMERVDPAAADVQLLVVAADVETAADVAAAAVRLAGDRGISALAATSAARAGRLLKLRPHHIVVGTPRELLQLIKSTVLKLDRVKAVALAWVDELEISGAEAQLETLLIDVPKEAARVIVTADVTPAVEALIERYARRPRRVTAAPPAEGEVGTAIGYVSVASAARAVTLRRLLDELDPASAVVFTRNEDSERDARATLGALGYGPDDTVRVARTGGGDAELVVLYDLPATREELREAVGAKPRRVVALAQPRQLSSLRALAGDAAVTPLVLPEAALRARSREAKLLAEVRDVLARETYARELLTLEPLLDAYDGIEIAAAVLRLLERERTASAEGRPAAPSAAGAGTARLFVNIGSRDNAGPGDLMGAIVNETPTPKESVGRIDVRDTFSLVEVPAQTAEAIAEKLTGVTIRGRRVLARVDQERAPRSDRPREERPRGERAREERPRRERPREDRPRSDRPRSDRPRSDRPREDRPRGSDRPRSDRPRGDKRGAGERARPPRREP